jgi:serine/threonine protein kinase
MCESSALNCLLLKGLIGLPASQQQCWESEKLEAIFIAVCSALKYANEKKWAHLDVRPSNILTSVDFNPPNGDIKVMLIDWGCASRTTANVRSFVGCTPYAHDQLFDLSTNPCHPSLDHDLASARILFGKPIRRPHALGRLADHRNVSVDVRTRDSRKRAGF